MRQRRERRLSGILGRGLLRQKLEAGDPIEDGLKNKMFSSIGEKGVQATIVTEDNKITEIRVGS